MSLSSEFGYRAAGAASEVNVAKKATILSCAAPNLKISPAIVKPVAIDPAKPGAAGLAQEAKVNAMAGHEHNARQLAAGAECVRQLKAEALEVCKVLQVDVAHIAPQAMAPDSAAELGLGALTPDSVGLGKGTAAQLASGALKMSSPATLASDMVASMKGSSREDVCAYVQDVMIANSPANYQPPAILQDSRTTALPQQLNFDWGAIFAADEDALNTILSCNGQDFSGFEELQVICDAQKGFEDQIAEMAAVEALSVDKLFPVSAAACEHMVHGRDQAAVIVCADDTVAASMVHLEEADRDVIKNAQGPVHQSIEAGLRNLAAPSAEALLGPRPPRDTSTA